LLVVTAEIKKKMGQLKKFGSSYTVGTREFGKSGAVRRKNPRKVHTSRGCEGFLEWNKSGSNQSLLLIETCVLLVGGGCGAVQAGMFKGGGKRNC